MCYGCWQKRGAPRIDNERVREAVQLADEVYEFNCAGGGLHVLLDDFNVDDDSFCVRYTGHDDADTPPEQIATEERCAAAFLALTVEERASALAMRNNWYGTPDLKETP